MTIMNKLLKLIGFERKGYQSETYHFKWGEVSWHPKKWDLGLKVCNWGCESRNLLIIKPLFCSIYINLSKEYDRDDEGFDYGFYIYDWYALALSWGSKTIHWDFPYIAKEWDRTEIFDVEGNLKFVDKAGINTGDERYDIVDKIQVSYPYKYYLKNGDIQEREAKVHVTNMVWTRKWFPFLKINRRYIDVNFSEEVGEGVDSWKGGCTSCGYDLKQGETPEQCLRRMEKERKFDR